MRRGLLFALLALGLFLLPLPRALGQTTSTESTATTKVALTQTAGRSGITAGGEGFPWIPVGIGILIAGLVGSRLRRASRR